MPLGATLSQTPGVGLHEFHKLLPIIAVFRNYVILTCCHCALAQMTCAALSFFFVLKHVTFNMCHDSFVHEWSSSSTVMNCVVLNTFHNILVHVRGQSVSAPSMPFVAVEARAALHWLILLGQRRTFPGSCPNDLKTICICTHTYSGKCCLFLIDVTYFNWL